MNSIRNTFAHSSRTGFGETDARDFFNAWPPSFRETSGKDAFDQFEFTERRRRARDARRALPP